jgi:hypothetical protein
LKRCPQCQQTKPLADFPLDAAGAGGRHGWCRICKAARMRDYYAANGGHAALDRAYREGPGRVNVLLSEARKRARKRVVPFAITADHVLIPDICPILGIPLVTNRVRARADSPSIDRIEPALGYVPGNVHVISFRANTMKSDASPAELLMLADWIYKTFGHDP